MVLEKVREKVEDKVKGGVLDMIEKLVGDIDAFDQIAELLKTVVPLKAEVTVKGKKAVEVKAIIKSGQLWIGFKRIREKPAEAEDVEQVEES